MASAVGLQSHRRQESAAERIGKAGRCLLSPSRARVSVESVERSWVGGASVGDVAWQPNPLRDGWTPGLREHTTTADEVDASLDAAFGWPTPNAASEGAARCCRHNRHLMRAYAREGLKLEDWIVAPALTVWSLATTGRYLRQNTCSNGERPGALARPPSDRVPSNAAFSRHVWRSLTPISVAVSATVISPTNSSVSSTARFWSVLVIVMVSLIAGD